jgi:hypothetical protein
MLVAHSETNQWFTQTKQMGEIFFERGEATNLDGFWDSIKDNWRYLEFRYGAQEPYFLCIWCRIFDWTTA